MGTVVVSEFVTIDGVFDDPGGAEGFERGGWAFQFDRGAEGDRFKFDELMAADALLLGRVTYEGFAQAWPDREGTGEFAAKMNAMPKHVVSTTLQGGDWNNTTVIGAGVGEAVRALKAAVVGDILVAGSATLVQTLLAEDLVDEYRLMVFPIVLGSGRRLFAETGAPARLRLTDSRVAGDTFILTYEPVRAEAGGAG